MPWLMLSKAHRVRNERLPTGASLRDHLPVLRTSLSSHFGNALSDHSCRVPSPVIHAPKSTAQFASLQDYLTLHGLVQYDHRHRLSTSLFTPIFYFSIYTPLLKGPGLSSVLSHSALATIIRAGHSGSPFIIRNPTRRSKVARPFHHINP